MLIFLFFLILITFLDRACISLVGVRIKSAFHLTNEQFGWVLGAFTLAYAIFEIPSAILGDRIGQRAVFIRIVLWWSLFTALTGATTGLLTLMGTRFLFGMGEAGAFPNSAGTISRWFPVNETSKALSSLYIGTNTGAGLAPLIIVPIAISFGWRAPFFVNGFIGLVWVLVCFIWFKNHPSEMKRITKEEKNFIETNRRFINEKRRFTWKTAFKNRSVWALSLSNFCCGLGNFYPWLPVYLQQGRHFSENEMKMATSYLYIIGIIGAFSGGLLSDLLVKRKGVRFGRRFIGMLSMVMFGALVFVAGTTTSNTIVVVSLITGHLFLSPFSITSFSTCIDIGGNHAATIGGIMNFFGQMGSFFMAIVFGKIVDVTHSFNAPLLIIPIVLFISGLLWLAIDPAKKLFSSENINKAIPQYQ